MCPRRSGSPSRSLPSSSPTCLPLSGSNYGRINVTRGNRAAVRLAEEYRRRLQPETRAQCTSLATVEAQIGKLRQGVARLIDSYAEGLIDKPEFEPRLTRLRQRIARLEEQRQQLADEAAVHAELQLIIGRLEDFAANVHHGLEAPDWANKRDLIRTLVKRVEIAQNEVNIVFRVDPY